MGEWIAAFVRLLAGWILVTALLDLPGQVTGWVMSWNANAGESWPRAILYGNSVSLVVTLIVATFIWRDSDVIAGRIVRRSRSSDSVDRQLLSDLQIALFAFFGVYLLIDAAPTLAQLVIQYRTLPDGFELMPSVHDEQLARIVGVAVQLVFAVWLLLYPDGFAALLRRARAAISGHKEHHRRRDENDEA